jgi:Xaa-Pro aminopeptidase
MANGQAAALRLGKVREWMAEQGLDAFVVRNTSDIAWLSSFDGVFDEEQAHCVLVTAKRAVLHTDSRYSEACEREAEGGPIAVDASRAAHAAWCVERLDGAATLGFDDTMSVREHRAFQEALEKVAAAVQFLPTVDAILTLRAS